MNFLQTLDGLWGHMLPYLGTFLAAFCLSLIFTPFARMMLKKFGMVDKPGPRRINKTPIPRGGGVAICLSCSLVLLLFVYWVGWNLSPKVGNGTIGRLMLLGGAICALGFTDDRFGLKPLIKLLGQLGVAVAAYFWCGVGFYHIFPEIPMYLDLPLTVFWITGAVNAFNLIDGLDGLATGLATIAAAGCAASLLFMGSPSTIIVYLAFMGACLGFLRYNFHPASIFLGDSGSMYLGFMLSTLPLYTRSGDSLLVSVGVPLLAMGIPIFDTSLAILRRSVRAILSHEEGGRNEGNDKIMTADSDHLHHRLLRKFTSQRKTALALYGGAAFLVFVGLAAVAFRDRAAAFFIIAFVVAVVVMVRDMRRVELWDVGRLADVLVHEHKAKSEHARRWFFWIPFLIIYDLVMLSASFILAILTVSLPFTKAVFHTQFPLFVVPMFVMLVLFRAYHTVWGRAMLSNYLRLWVAMFLGVAISLALSIFFEIRIDRPRALTLVFLALSFSGAAGMRTLRPFLRDLFYMLSSNLMRDKQDTERILVYGAGLRYRSFRRELVRRASSQRRLIVGLLDDDILLHGLYVGGVRVLGGLQIAPQVIHDLRVNTVIVAAVISDEKRAQIKDTLKPTGVTLRQFSFTLEDLK